MPKLTIKTKRTGRVQAVNLDNGALSFIGKIMVLEQKARWAKGINADGNAAKKLSVKAAVMKAKLRSTNRPIRDMQMTGGTLANFQLRKAINGVIRAENTTREARRKATRANSYEQMIGFSGTDQIKLFQASKIQYGKWLKKAWVPIG